MIMKVNMLDYVIIVDILKWILGLKIYGKHNIHVKQ